MGIRGEKTALVLSGGGSRGAYQVGAWRAINELGIKYDMVVGVSVGALNGGMAVQENQPLAEELWRKIETDNVFDIEAGAQPVDYAKELIARGGVSAQPLQKLVKKYINEESVRKSSIDFGLLTLELPTFKPHYLWKNQIPKGKLGDYVVASASVFPGVKPQRIDGVDYVDGGAVNVMPIHMAVEKGATRVIAIYLKAAGRLDKSELSLCDDTTLIEPLFDLGSFLIFDRENSSRLIRLGYMDAMRAFGVYDGKYYSFIKGIFDKKNLKGADAAAHMFDLDPLILYSKPVYMDVIGKAVVVEELRQEKDLKQLRDGVLLREVLKNSRSVTSAAEAAAAIKEFRDHSSKQAITLMIAKDIKEKGEKSFFSTPYIPRSIGEQRLAARFLVNNNLV